MFRYTFLVHNFPSASKAAVVRRDASAPSSTTVRRATRADVGQILELVSQYAAEGLMLPRTFDQIASRIDSYVVSADSSGAVVACAALEEYSPSLAEVSSVAVAQSHQGRGLGSQVVLGVERLARSRDIEELFAMSLTDNFFLALSYQPTTISRYPEKLARYDILAKEGVEIVPKRCFAKELGGAWTAPKLVEQTAVSAKRKKLA
jgi:amino-acid N-acetyltransferase